MKRFFFVLAAFVALLACDCCSRPAVDYAAFVNPKIGSGGHGHVFVGANVPFGFVQLGPTSIPIGWDWCSGYHVSDSTVIGFSHTHLSGTGIGDLFDVTVMPTTGRPTPGRGTEDHPETGAWSYADRTKEVCEPGYYSVPLERWNVVAEMTATTRVGFHRYTYPASDDAFLVFDLENGGCYDMVTETGFDEVVRDEEGRVTAFGGHRFSHGWADNQKVFFWAEVSRPGELAEEINPETVRPGREPRYGYLSLGKTEPGEQVLLKVALSPVSVDGAKANMAAELPGWDFEATRKAARQAWNKELSCVNLTCDDPDARAVFYTALYHTMVAPSVFNDVDGQYRGSDDVVRQGDFQNYTTFSLWDTYRAAMPLMTILHPERCNDITKTFYHIYKEQGDLPVWHLMGNETDCMVGNPGLISFADNIVKGFDGGLSREQLLQAMIATATRPDRGQDLRMQYGFIPSDLFNESVAFDMEYAVADGALSNAAAYLGDAATADAYRERSHSYRHFWDPETQFMRGRLADGSFRTPFNPLGSDHRSDDYTEGTAWQYIWLVPQDVEGLVELFGSREATVAKLDSLFLASSVVEGENASMDISGLIGQYAHGNEPGHHTIYLYSMLGEPDKAADRIRQVYKEMYFNDVEGLAGNEDVGQMSAWYLLSSFGFYQVEPAVPRFWFGAPNYEKMEIKVAGGTFTITAKGLSDENRYIRGVKLNGKPYDLPYINYKDIVAGGTLEYTMGR
ncbi:MAG: GH92 family glycosyl hydrolase [Bacteroidales bacterium]|nr:GH92 family glycosyl hydrolase [Bacteroidales bacterium]